ncbi:hypothetical protein LEP1GSC107_3710 [Leptospira interrogans serovar Grippotyphosa str. UI 12769]|uniref:Uncharacterized protein n=1 Tax=Leptospira interrogans str. FPW1039 TaxID=1193040 RepID=A0A0F6ICX0_LEPIR|nr:hypothetical protein LEP1GSC069_0792 [Leptospira interrogans serovar Canicola str. Fiocruz LV133]EKR46506.1 hypothetical protein LEP1GSC097_1676 [Leptospira interrogans serovar Grippotyphosa str. UI 08368]EKR83414.1 hypothetical protein LEP1GSC099_2492 [Leptospira interrogans str. UI 08452]EMJ35895.1 hypothetical protein LEP1GSC079_1560 [Leptospira interrogans str. FPW1039]EMM89110.1 hypothetical protein LEP1GSC145_3220 [Leptospira interrogans serovar Djasiman str. LT1649]EMN33741.1 hypothe
MGGEKCKSPVMDLSSRESSVPEIRFLIHVGTLTNRDFTDEFFKCGNSHKSRFYR